MVSIIFSADYDFQVISIVLGSSSKAWDIANKYFSGGILTLNQIEHFDVIEFSNLNDANIWIIEQVKESRQGKY